MAPSSLQDAILRLNAMAPAKVVTEDHQPEEDHDGKDKTLGKSVMTPKTKSKNTKGERREFQNKQLMK